ncbi:MAG: tyrosine-protein phosphatase [Bdellovibrio sp.]|nr:tyrosine-protein phosphatase [Bdellovibrio sp.]
MKLQGAINFRDMGGTVSVEGHRLKKNHFFRSGALSKLTPEDLQSLQNLSIVYIIDYRDPRESELDKDLLWQGVKYENCPANPASHRMSANLGSFFTTEHLENVPAQYMEDLYRQLPFNNSAYHRMFAVMDSMNSQQGMLQHCAVGKDRTGVGCALMLLSLGVREEDVMSEYLLTQQGLEPFRQKLMSQFAGVLSSKAMDRFQYMMGAHESFLNAALTEIRKQAGTVDKFLESEYGITAQRKEAWLQKFFE